MLVSLVGIMAVEEEEEGGITEREVGALRRRGEESGKPEEGEGEGKGCCTTVRPFLFHTHSFIPFLSMH